MNKRYQIFISSTYKDLIVERQKVIEAILKLYHFPIGMEMFHADNEEQWSQIKRTIDMSDYYILIMGRYCGTLINSENISYTEKEYNYALMRGIPILSFVIDNGAKKESYGDETSKQKRALSKFRKRVLKLPCSFWETADQLAWQVTTTLTEKFKEDNRNGWVPYNKLGCANYKFDDHAIAGEYIVRYYTGLINKEQRLTLSKLIIQPTGEVIFYNNLKGGNFEALDSEYIYHGTCIEESDSLYLHLKNDYSSERIVFTLLRPAGDLKRYIGLLTALSSSKLPICVKVACFEKSLFQEGIDMSTLDEILLSENSEWDKSVFVVEDNKRWLFFSDSIIQNK